LFVAQAELVTLTDTVLPANIVFVFGLLSLYVLLVVISCAVVNRLVVLAYTFQAHAAHAHAAAVLTALFTGNK
jgi:hypothetical protein